MAEAIGFAMASRCRLQLSHVNPMGRANWDAIEGLFGAVDRARADGLDVAFDIVGYTAWTLTAMEALPHVVSDLGDDAVLAMAARSEGRAHLRELVERAWPAWPPWVENRVTRNIPLEMGWDAIYVADEAPGFASARGKTLGALAGERGADPFDLYFDLLEASGGKARLVNDGYGGDFQDEAPLLRLAVRPDAIPETDTSVVPVHGKLTLPLPMFWGTMPRFIARFSRDLEPRRAAGGDPPNDPASGPPRASDRPGRANAGGVCGCRATRPEGAGGPGHLPRSRAARRRGVGLRQRRAGRARTDV